MGFTKIFNTFIPEKFLIVGMESRDTLGQRLDK